MNVSDLTGFLDKKFPLKLQENYDNAGVQIEFADNNIKNILLSIDIDENVINEAIEKNCNLIITHHPFIFTPIKNIKTGYPASDHLLKLIENKISVYSAHTNLDKIYFNKFGSMIGIKNECILDKTDNIDDIEYGIGSVGDLPEPMTLNELIFLIKKVLKIDFLLSTGDLNSIIKKAAFINGAAGRRIQDILSEKKADCIITGDISYHYYKDAQNFKIPLIDAGHFGSEKILLNFLKEEINIYLENSDKDKLFNVYISESESNPIKIMTF